jgi:dihydrofolate synthase/folylpolyglutamate synthase
LNPLNPTPEDRPRFDTLDAWLQWQESLHPASIDLGLKRVARVADRLQCRVPAPVVISVAGTNGKGSCVALLEAMLLREGYRVASYTSPHLLRYNERVRLRGQTVSDAQLIDAFARVDRALCGDTLTYFEFGTLAALDIMTRETLDVAILEVGLGGRLDAVNIVDADAALLSSVGVDHSDWLGPDRQSIGREKAGIFRAAKPAVCGDPDPPPSVSAHAQRVAAELRVLGRDFTLRRVARGWHWQGQGSCYRDLPLPALSGAHQLANAASVLMVLEMLSQVLPVSRKALEGGLRWARLPGRIEIIPGKVEQVLDVSHNAQAAQALVDTLRHLPLAGTTHAVLGMMADKDAEAFIGALRSEVQYWYAVGLPVARARQAQQLAAQIVDIIGSADTVRSCASVFEALTSLRERTRAGDRVLVCGSFYTVAEWARLKPAFGAG